VSLLVAASRVRAYVGKKQNRVRPEDSPLLGDAYAFVAIDTRQQARRSK